MENLDWRLGLKPETIPVFEAVSQLDVLKDLYLCGGTAQSIQMMHRKSEDLDFELLGIRKDRPHLDSLSRLQKRIPREKPASGIR